jgi:hypothetical protein
MNVGVFIVKAALQIQSFIEWFFICFKAYSGKINSLVEKTKV